MAQPTELLTQKQPLSGEVSRRWETNTGTSPLQPWSWCLVLQDLEHHWWGNQGCCSPSLRMEHKVPAVSNHHTQTAPSEEETGPTALPWWGFCCAPLGAEGRARKFGEDQSPHAAVKDTCFESTYTTPQTAGNPKLKITAIAQCLVNNTLSYKHY